MKKIYGFIAMLLMCFVTSAQAQHSWTAEEQSVEEAAFQTGEGHFYVLQEGDNTKTNDAGEEVNGGHSSGKFLSSAEGSQSANITHDCIFSFIPTGEMVGEFPVYVLYNIANGQYLAAGNKYVATKAQAFPFTARKAVAKAEADVDGEGVEWIDYSNAVSATRSMYAEANGAWVLCHPSKKQYIGFIGAVSFQGYVDTNNWYIRVATEQEMSAFDKLMAVWEKAFPNGEPTLDIYPVGTNPGCVSQEVFDQLLAAYNEGNALSTGGSDEECLAAIEHINAALDAYQKGFITLTNGYYLVKNKRGGFMKTKNGKAFVDNNLTYPVESWNLNNAAYIWKVETAEQAGKFLFKNFSANLYVGGGNQFNMVEKGAAFLPEQRQGINFILFDGGNQINAKRDGFLTHWNDKNDEGNHFQFYLVDSLVIDSLNQKVQQQQIDKKLAALVRKAGQAMKRVAYKNGFVEDGFYNSPADSGLVTAFAKCNATEPSEGKEAYAFDGKLDTYYHTRWSGNEFPADYHWVQVDLGKEVQEIYVKFSYRHNNNNSNPSRIALIAPEDGNPEAEVWGDTLYEDTVVYAYTTAFPAGDRDSTTYIGKIKLNKPVQHLRMAATRTKVNQIKGGGPLWHVSELRFYDAADCVENPKFTMVPAEIKQALNEAVQAGKDAVAAHTSTEEHCAAIDSALADFWAAYPDPSDLIYNIEVAEEMAATAVEGDLMGQYEAGSVAVLQAALASIKANIEGKDLTLEEIKKYQAELDAALAEFNSKLRVPESGAVYRIQCVAPDNFDGDVDAHRQWESYVSSINADVEGNPKWGYRYDTEIANRMNALWLVTKDEKGFMFKNLANGLYLNNPYDGLTEDQYSEVKGTKLGFSVEPKHFALESSSVTAGAFLVKANNGQFLNCDPNGNVVHYFDRTDIHAIFAFEKVAEAETTITGNIIDVKPGKVQIITLPYAVSSVLTAADNFTGTAYKVLGKKGNQIVLDKVTEGEGIAAGVPFIVETLAENVAEGVEAETYINAFLQNEDALTQTYNYEQVVVNGLVSAPRWITVGAGYGMIIGKTVVPTSETDQIAAGSGFFNNEIPETAEEGTFFLNIEGNISGEGTAVENVAIQKNVASDVYTISGVKVRSNVKAASATKNLPKGVYVVAGKKVVVK